MTGSGLLVSADRQRVLMNHHKGLDKWLCFGGHADGETDIFNAARREVIEESGIEAIEPVSSAIFALDVHEIPANENRQEPAHYHFDITFLFQTAAVDSFLSSDESYEVRWCSFAQALELLDNPQGKMGQILRKWHSLKTE